MEKKINNTRYRASVNTPVEQFKDMAQGLIKSITHAYNALIKEAGLNPDLYHPVIGWDYVNDDFIKNRITVIITATHNDIPVDYGNYKLSMSKQETLPPKGKKEVKDKEIRK